MFRRPREILYWEINEIRPEGLQIRKFENTEIVLINSRWALLVLRNSF
jgi:hypothetical protein